MKTYKPLFCKRLSKNLIAKIPTIKLLKNPATKGAKVNTSCEYLIVVYNSYAPAKATIGIDNKNENLAAFLRFNPNNIPPDIVEPDLETPGSNANAWNKPIIKAFDNVTFLSFFQFAIFSARNINTEPANKNIATNLGDLRSPVIVSCKKYPIIPAGIEPNKIYNPHLPSSV